MRNEGVRALFTIFPNVQRFCVRDMRLRFPSIFIFALSGPFDQVLLSPINLSFANDGVNRILVRFACLNYGLMVQNSGFVKLDISADFNSLIDGVPEFVSLLFVMVAYELEFRCSW